MADILIIEDSELLQRAYRRLLRGHTLKIVDTGLEALKLLEDGKFDLIVSDGDLTGDLHGKDVWLWVKNNRPDLVNKFMFCSHNRDIADLCETEALPYNDKSDPLRLLNTVNDLLGAQL